jgi:hypothetical protein
MSTAKLGYCKLVEVLPAEARSRQNDVFVILMVAILNSYLKPYYVKLIPCVYIVCMSIMNVFIATVCSAKADLKHCSPFGVRLQ